MRPVRACWLACLVACTAAPEPPQPTPPPAPTASPAAAPTPTPRATGPQPLRAYTRAAPTTPANPDAAACDAAAEQAHAAGILDLAAHWRAEARDRESTPAREQAWRAAQAEAGLTTPVRRPQPLPLALVRAVRTASEAHAWDQVLALTGPALASAPHHELYLWTGDALWQLGRDREARQMWSRARVLLRRTGTSLHLLQSTTTRVEQLAWGRGGLLFVGESADDSRWVEVWGDRLERPWRRWQIPWRRMYAWRDDQLVEADADRLTLIDPASGTELASVAAHADGIAQLVAAAAAPVAATVSERGEIKLWGATPEHPLAPLRTLREAGEAVQIALDPGGTRLAIHRPGQPIELVRVRTGAKRTLKVAPDDPSPRLLFLDEHTLLVSTRDARTRVTLRDPGPDEVTTLAHDVRELLAASADELAFLIRSPAPSSPHRLEFNRDLLRCPTRGGACRTTPVPFREAAYAPDGARLALLLSGLEVLDVATDATSQVVSTHLGRDPVPHVSRDASAIAVARLGFAVWDTRTGAQRLLREAHEFVAFTPDSAAVVAHDRERDRVEILPLAGGAPVALALPDRVEGHAFSPDGRRLALANTTTVGVWDATTGAALWQETVPEPPRGLALTARDELVYQTGGALRVRDAAGQRPARTILANPRMGDWSVSPDGAELLVCDYNDLSTQLLDLATARPRRTFAATCSPRYTAADAAFVTTHADLLDSRIARLDPRTGALHPLDLRRGFELVSVHGDGAALVVETYDHSRVLLVRGDGHELARLHTHPDLGWLLVTSPGALDGDANALAHTDALLRDRGRTQRFPAALAWDGLHVPGLLPRVLAGELVAPPLPR